MRRCYWKCLKRVFVTHAQRGKIIKGRARYIGQQLMSHPVVYLCFVAYFTVNGTISRVKLVSEIALIGKSYSVLKKQKTRVNCWHFQQGVKVLHLYSPAKLSTSHYSVTCKNHL